jgi:hypothetical protein
VPSPERAALKAKKAKRPTQTRPDEKIKKRPRLRTQITTAVETNMTKKLTKNKGPWGQAKGV